MIGDINSGNNTTRVSSFVTGHMEYLSTWYTRINLSDRIIIEEDSGWLLSLVNFPFPRRIALAFLLYNPWRTNNDTEFYSSTGDIVLWNTIALASSGATRINSRDETAL